MGEAQCLLVLTSGDTIDNELIGVPSISGPQPVAQSLLITISGGSVMMRPSYNVWIVMRFEARAEKDIFGVCFNREVAERLQAEKQAENPKDRIVLRAGNAFDSGY